MRNNRLEIIDQDKISNVPNIYNADKASFIENLFLKPKKIKELQTAYFSFNFQNFNFMTFDFKTFDFMTL